MNEAKRIKVVAGALKSCIDAHGPITREHVTSAAKRIVKGDGFVELIRKEFKVEIENNEGMPAFGGCYIPDDPKNDVSCIALNTGSCLLVSVQEDISFKEIVLETLMHEFGHALEYWLGLEADEERIEALVNKYREKYSDPTPATP